MTQKSDFLCEDISSSVQEVHSIIQKLTKTNKQKTTKQQKYKQAKKPLKTPTQQTKTRTKILDSKFYKGNSLLLLLIVESF